MDSNQKKVLFSSFVRPEHLETSLKKLTSFYNLYNQKVVVYDTPATDELVVTYDVCEHDAYYAFPIPNTLFTRRKAKFDTLYTINAVRAITGSESPDDRNPIDWYNFRNSFLLTESKRLRVLPLKNRKAISIHN